MIARWNNIYQNPEITPPPPSPPQKGKKEIKEKQAYLKKTHKSGNYICTCQRKPIQDFYSNIYKKSYFHRPPPPLLLTQFQTVHINCWLKLIALHMLIIISKQIFFFRLKNFMTSNTQFPKKIRHTEYKQLSFCCLHLATLAVSDNPKQQYTLQTLLANILVDCTRTKPKTWLQLTLIFSL